jgi:hypothetical protein
MAVDHLKKRVAAKELSDFVDINLKCSSEEDLTDKLGKCQEVSDVLSTLLHHRVIVFYDIDVLERIIRRFLEEPKLDSELQQYNEKLDEYLKMRICDYDLYLQNKVRIGAPSSSQLVLFMDSYWTGETSQKKLYRLESRIATVLKYGTVRLHKIRCSSLIVCYNISKKVFAHHKIQIEQVLELMNFGVMVLQEKISGCEYSECMETAYEEYLKNWMLTVLPVHLSHRG